VRPILVTQRRGLAKWTPHKDLPFINWRREVTTEELFAIFSQNTGTPITVSIFTKSFVRIHVGVKYCHVYAD
jgi:hypothetical protein